MSWDVYDNGRSVGRFGGSKVSAGHNDSIGLDRPGWGPDQVALVTPQTVTVIDQE